MCRIPHTVDFRCSLLTRHPLNHEHVPQSASSFLDSEGLDLKVTVNGELLEEAQVCAVQSRLGPLTQ